MTFEISEAPIARPQHKHDIFKRDPVGTCRTHRSPCLKVLLTSSKSDLTLAYTQRMSVDSLREESTTMPAPLPRGGR
jgi:hypothetical protein